MTLSRPCYESASAAGAEARRQRVIAWAAEMTNLPDPPARDLPGRFDQVFELQPYVDESEDVSIFGEAAPHLRLLDSRGVDELISKLPVCPGGARDVIDLAFQQEISLTRLESIARSDAGLGGELMAASNSGFGSPRPPADVREALARLGTDHARNVLVAAALKTAFGAGIPGSLWRHSLEVARTAERLARAGGMLSAGESFLAGLCHDIGQLVFLAAPEAAKDRARRLTNAGCPAAGVEQAVYGIDHSRLGAMILANWRFPRAMQDAVRFHHCPERGDVPLAHVIYAGEFRTDMGEDLPSLARLRAAATVIGVPLDTITGPGFDDC